MKKQMKILALSILLMSILISSCKKDELNNISKNEITNPKSVKESLKSFNIPDDCKSKSDYKGEVIVFQEVLKATINGIQNEGSLYIEVDTNGYLIFVGYSENMANAFGLDENVMLIDENHKIILESITMNIKKSILGKIWGAVKFVFWGEEKHGPCLYGNENAWVQHWLIGAHGWHVRPC